MAQPQHKESFDNIQTVSQHVVRSMKDTLIASESTFEVMDPADRAIGIIDGLARIMGAFIAAMPAHLRVEVQKTAHQITTDTIKKFSSVSDVLHQIMNR